MKRGTRAQLKTIHVISAHAEGEVGDVIVGGVLPPPGETLWAQSRWIAQDQTLRNFVLNEPRGGVFRHVNLLVLPKHPEADAAFIIMEPEDTPPMSGSNSICVATVLLDAGLVPMVEPETTLTLEAVWQGRAHLRAERAFLRRRPGPAAAGGGARRYRIGAYGGDSFVVVDAAALGLDLVADEAHRIAKLGVSITNAANQQLKFRHPDNPDWTHFSFCLFAGPLTEGADGLEARAAVAIQPGKVDRSPTGTALSARLAILHARGLMAVGDSLTVTSVIDSTFRGTIVAETSLGGQPAVIPEISGRGWITGTHQHMLDPDDPWPEGYKLSDTWGAR